MPKIPDRWIPYKACGKVIEGTKIICFKVPLSRNVQSGITEIWDIPALLEKVPNLGAVIDLTNTARYYDPSEFQAAGVLYTKILMPGRIIPPEAKVMQFMDTVDELLGKNCDFLIGVHCTHGLNRTGYMVCRYMRDRLGIAGEDAIKRFETARGYEIERSNYIAHLLNKQLPPPDLGKETSLKPLLNENNSRSYISQGGREDNIMNSYEYSDKYHHIRSYKRRRGPDSDTESTNCADRIKSKRTGKKRKKSNSMESIDWTYDY